VPDWHSGINTIALPSSELTWNNGSAANEKQCWPKNTTFSPLAGRLGRSPPKCVSGTDLRPCAKCQPSPFSCFRGNAAKQTDRHGNTKLNIFPLLRGEIKTVSNCGASFWTTLHLFYMFVAGADEKMSNVSDDRAGISTDADNSVITSSSSRSAVSSVAELQTWTFASTTEWPVSHTETTINATDVVTTGTVSESTSEAPISGNNTTDRQYRTGIELFYTSAKPDWQAEVYCSPHSFHLSIRPFHSFVCYRNCEHIVKTNEPILMSVAISGPWARSNQLWGSWGQRSRPYEAKLNSEAWWRIVFSISLGRVAFIVVSGLLKVQNIIVSDSVSLLNARAL